MDAYAVLIWDNVPTNQKPDVIAVLKAENEEEACAEAVIDCFGEGGSGGVINAEAILITEVTFAFWPYEAT